MRGKSTSRAAVFLLCAAILLPTGSCIYFNTMYNARRIYAEAEEMEKESDNRTSNRGLKDKYQEVVIRCSKVLRDHPESSWVDDALFLMGKALVKQNDLGKGIRKFQELTTNYPESEYVPHSHYWLALANLEKREYNQALFHIERFLEDYPDHEIVNDVLFLAGDINIELENDEAALGYYSQVAENAGDREVMEEAVQKRADLHYHFENWEKAAESYGSLLRKGMKWQHRYDITLLLGDCLVKTGKCAEALDLYDEILPLVTKIQDEAPVMLGQAASHACMDSTELAMGVYDTITKRFPRSKFSSEAFYRLGVIYHEKLDSLQLAQESFDKSGQEASSSEFALIAKQKAGSIKRLLELQSQQGGDNSIDLLAEKKFMAAEIQLTRLGETENAMGNYKAVLDSFPDSRFAPMAAYAMGFIYQKELSDSTSAISSWQELVTKYPRSPQALGALSRIESAGFADVAVGLQAYVDSAMADTAGVAEDLRRQREIAVQDSLRLADARQAEAGRPAGTPGATGEQTSRPSGRDDLQASRMAREGRFSPRMLKMVRRRRFEELRRQMWGGVASRADSTSTMRP